MKSLKTIIIAGIVLVVFILASVILINIPKAAEPEAEEETTKAPTETVYVINRDYDSLERFVVVPTERQVDEDTEYAYAAEALDVTVLRETDEKGSVSYSYDVSPDPGKFEYDTSKFRSMLYTLTSISAVKLVEEDAKNLADYGLDEPTAVIETYYADGSQVDIIIGSKAPVDDNYYCMTSDSGNVYTIGSYVDSLLVRKPIEYRDITLFPAYTEDDIYTNINWVKLTERDESCIEVKLDSDASDEFNTEGSQYVMYQPYKVSGNDTTIKQYVMDVVSTLTLGSIVKDITEEEYKEYGLNQPAKLEMSDVAGNEVSLLVGDPCPNRDYVYCMLEGTDTLLTCNASAMNWMGLSYVQLMLRTVWSYSIDRLQSLEIDLEGETFDIQVSHFTKQNANGNDTDGVEGTLNGVEITPETNIRRLYIRCLYFRIVDNLTDAEKEEYSKAKADGSITINLDEDESHTLELIRMTDRKYALRLDGELEYYCYKKNITSLLDSIHYVQDGDELDFNLD